MEHRWKCDRCWKPTKPDELVTVRNGEWLLQFCKKCAEETGNVKKEV